MFWTIATIPQYCIIDRALKQLIDLQLIAINCQLIDLQLK